LDVGKEDPDYPGWVWLIWEKKDEKRK